VPNIGDRVASFFLVLFVVLLFEKFRARFGSEIWTAVVSSN
jgi:hypothetical protein